MGSEDQDLGRDVRLRGAPAAMHWYQEGKDPDYRFSLANERTFLAWMRTALAILAGALVLHQLRGHLHIGEVATLFGAALAILAGGLGAAAYGRWKGNELAMRHSRALPLSRLVPALSILAAAVSLAAALVMLLEG